MRQCANRKVEPIPSVLSEMVAMDSTRGHPSTATWRETESEKVTILFCFERNYTLVLYPALSTGCILGPEGLRPVAPM